MRPRIPPKSGKADVAPEHHAVVDQALAVFGSVRGPFSILLHSPDLASKLLPLVPWFRTDCVVDHRLRLIGVLAAVRERATEYVWAAQVRLARELGVRDDTIAVLRTGGDVTALAEDEQEVVAFARQMMRTNTVEQPVFDAVLKRHGEQWVVELTAAIGFYAMLCAIAGTFDVPAPPEGDRIG